MYSLRKRFFLATIAIVFAFALVLSFALDQSFKRKLRQSEFNSLQGRVYTLLASAEVEEGTKLFMDRTRLSSFRSPETKAYVLDEKNQILWSSENKKPRNLPSEVMESLPSFEENQWNFKRLRLPFFLSSYDVTWVLENHQNIPLRFVVLHSSASFSAERQAHQKKVFVWILAGGILLLLIQLWFLRWGFAPVLEITKQVEDIQNEKRSKIEAETPIELQKLVFGINSFIAHQEKQNKNFRNAIDNLGHSLKTPLAALSTLIEKSELPKDDTRAMNDQVQRIKEASDYQIRKAHFVHAHFFSQEIALKTLVERALSALGKAHAEKGVLTRNEIEPTLKIRMNEGDALELVGNLLENAFKWCAHQVTVRGQELANGIRLSFIDDGQGFMHPNPTDLLKRGQRADETKPGSGFGLAIVAEIVEEWGGSIELKNCEPSGAQVDVFLPS